MSRIKKFKVERIVGFVFLVLAVLTAARVLTPDIHDVGFGVLFLFALWVADLEGD